MDWYWKDIEINNELIGDTIKKGSGYYEKEYVYIKIPNGCGYDNYGFWLSSNCVHIEKTTTYISICFDMKIELIYDNEKREVGKKYKRYKMTGEELFDNILKDYEINFQKEWLERERVKQEKKEQNNKKNIGKIVCGIYKGNYSVFDYDNHYRRDEIFRAYFKSKGGRYSNKKFQKIENVKVYFDIVENISKYEFELLENIINAYLIEYNVYYDRVKAYEKSLEIKYTKTELKCRPELRVCTDLEDINEHIYEENKKAMEEIKVRMLKRIEKIRNDRKDGV